MKFSEIIDRLNAGEVCRREAWAGMQFIVKQMPQAVPADIVPRMSSLPEGAKALAGKMGDGSISYHDQVLIVKSDIHENAQATSYIPTWEDIFAEDWSVE